MSLAPLKELRSLRSLDVNGTNVTTIGRLEGLTRLETLNIGYTKVNSVTALAPLKRLRTLVWGGYDRFHSVSDLHGLHKLTSLRTLELQATGIASFAKWKGLPELRTLKIEGGGLRSVAGLMKMKKLENLSLRWNRQLTSLSGFGGSSKLQSLDISFTKVKSFSGLGKLSKLKHLHASGARLTSLSGLTAYRGTLKSLDASRNNLRSVKAIRSLTKLKKLDLGSNRISSVKYLRPLTKLTHLKLGWNRIRSLQGLNKMKHMVLFQVRDQELTGSAATVGKPYTLPVVRTPGGSRIAYSHCSMDCTLKPTSVTWKQPTTGWVAWEARVRIGTDTAVFNGTFTQSVKKKK
ncbi:leucine-rich repeat domain-containing protein [Leucobacter soli]|uniref:leucine-rich repeat domain-containing protein n=1 Tax=Leucobacter soli TaxID=2812850 RepID=UPI00361FAEFC